MKKETLLMIIGAAIVLALVWLGFKKAGVEESLPPPHLLLATDMPPTCVEPVAKAFGKRSGIEVRVQSPGESNGTKPDLYWLESPLTALHLAEKGVLARYEAPGCRKVPPLFKDLEKRWCGVSAAGRVFFVDRNATEPPASVLEPGRAPGGWCVAKTLEGTGLLMGALALRLGTERALAAMKGWYDEGAMLTKSDEEAIAAVTLGHADWALVGSDAAGRAMQKGAEGRIVWPDQKDGGIGTLLVPTVVALAEGGAHPAAAKAFYAFLLSQEGQKLLAGAPCFQLPLALPGEGNISIMQSGAAAAARWLLNNPAAFRDWAGY
ncbi:ABC transporter substrate-binding protein [Hydrogenimonas sp.]